MKKIVLIFILILWIIIIYAFSNQPIKNSLKTSSVFVNKVVEVISNTTNTNKEIATKTITFIVRKVAHFTEFLILGILIYLVLSSFKVDRLIIISLILCFLCACCDEIHQIFVIGRSSKILDVIIDTCGSFVGILIYSDLHKKNKAIIE